MNSPRPAAAAPRVKCPYEINVVGWLFIVVGGAALGYHLAKDSIDRWMPLIMLLELLAVFGGIFLLRGANWARWLVLAWLAFHVVIAALNSFAQALPHIVLLVVIGYVLLVAPTSQYFRARPRS
ncbi:MAG: hypothetical protein WA823_16615 [Candidatus Acidiferrales bacterium]